MFKISRGIFLAAITSGLLASTAMSSYAGTTKKNFQSRSFEQPTKKRRSSDGGFFSFFNQEINQRKNKKIRKVIRTNRPSRPTFYSYRGAKKVVLADASLKQPLNRQLPAFSGNGPKNFDPTANFVGQTKLNDSLAQTIFDVLKQGKLVTRVTAKQKKAIVRFYKERNYAGLWTEMDGVKLNARAMLAYLAKANEEGLHSAYYLPNGLAGFHDDLAHVESDLEALAKFDINLTAMAVKYGQHASGGRVIPNRLSRYHDLKPPKVAASKVLQQLAAGNNAVSYLAGLHPTHKTYVSLKSALARIDGQPSEKVHPIIRSGGVIKVGQNDERVGLIRARLVEAELLPKDTADDYVLNKDVYDEEMSEAVKKYQKSKGLKADGIIGGRTFASFNPRKNLKKRNRIVLNMERMRWLPRQFGNKHIFVNQASYKLQVMQNDREIWQTRVIVGKPKNQTNFFIDKMRIVVFNPYWGVPQSIIAKEMLPRLQANPSYLDAKGFEVYNSRGKKVRSSSVDWSNYGGSRVPFSVRQPPSAKNALGKVKFLFPNKHAIYLHDTPSKSLFARSKRAFSHGCVRVKNPFTFAEKVLGWKRSRIDKKVASGKNGSVRLKQSIPVYLTYFTAWADQQGKVRFYGDVYGRDRQLDKALNQIAIASN